MSIHRSVALLGFGVSVVGCAVVSGGVTDTRRTNRSADYITRQEILDRAPTAQSAYDAVQRLRSTWLRPVGTTSFRQATEISVYVNNVRAPNLDFMRSLSITLVEEIRYYSATEATMQWGTGNTGGAIEIITDAQRRPVAARPPPVQEVTRPGPTFIFEPYEPFHVMPILQVNGASSIVTSPHELGDFWSPAYGVGGGIGLTVTEHVTVVGTFDYNRYTFQADRVVSFLEGVNGAYRLRRRDGVDVRGEPMSIFNVSGNVKFHPNWEHVAPYVTGGIGYMRMNAGAFSVTAPGGTVLPSDQFSPGRANGGDQRENSFSIAVGAGLDWRVNRAFGVFADVRYVIGFRGPRYGDILGEPQLLNTQYFPFRAGVSWRLSALTISQY